MKRNQIVNSCLVLLLGLIVSPLGYAQETKPERHLVVDAAKLPTDLVKNTESIQQVLMRSVLLSKQFEILFAKPESVSDTKMRVYELKTSIDPTDKPGFYNVSLELVNPKLQKTVRSEKEQLIHGKRLLHTLRIMTLRLIFGEAFILKNKEKLEKISAEDPALSLTPAPLPKGLPPAQKVEPLNNKKKDYDQSREDLNKKPESPSADKAAPFFREKTYALGAYYQSQQIQSSGELLDVNNNFTALLLDFHTHWKFDTEGESLAIVSGRYGRTLSKYEETIPDSLQLAGLYNRHLFSKFRGIAGLRLDQASFANLPGLNQGIQVGTTRTIWGQLGLETASSLFNRRFIFSANLLKALQSQVDFPDASGSEVSGQGYLIFWAYELTKKYFLALEMSKYIMSIAATSGYSNSDQRLALGIYYPLDEK
jgi:hypothetical protein